MTHSPTIRPPVDLDHEGDLNTSSAGMAVRKQRSVEALPVLKRDDASFLHQCLSTPCLDEVIAADGIKLHTRSGMTLMDFHGNGVHNVGFGHDRVVAAVKKQLDTLPYCTRRFTHELATRLAERLGQTTGGRLTKALFAPGGTLAIGIALKLARVATGKSSIVTMQGSFHGASMDVASLGGQDLFLQDVGPMLQPTCLAPAPTHSEPGAGFDPATDPTLVAIREHLEQGDVAAVLSEPIRWATAEVPHPGFWTHVRQLCDQHGALLIFDEVGSGLGRTGRMYAYQHFDVQPDMICLGKSLGGAVVPMAAVLARPELDVAGHLALGHYTHEKSPIGCAAALATLDVIEDEMLIDQSRLLGALSLEWLRDLALSHGFIKQVRGVGLLMAMDIQAKPTSATSDLANRIMYRCMETGLNFKVTAGKTLTLTPPLIINESQLRDAVDLLLLAIHQCARLTPT